jgi:uncharacterized protein (DUF362 family)
MADCYTELTTRGAKLCRRIRDHRHEYVIAREVLSSDVVISVPKLKVHRRLERL